MKVNVTLYNAETMIRPCLEAILKVCDSCDVYDFGSEDNGPAIVKELGIPITLYGRLSGEEYVKVKDKISKQSHKVLWVDGDEVWPEDSIVNVNNYLSKYNVVNGFWKNLKVRLGGVWVSDFMHRGAVAWNTKRFELHRTWPREKLRGITLEVNREKEEINPLPQEVFCYHGVLLNLSSLPDKKNRWKKRAERDDQSATLRWEGLDTLPFTYYDNRILDLPKFSWYK